MFVHVLKALTLEMIFTESIGLIGTLLIALNVLVSYRGFKNPSFFDAYHFEVDAILKRKDYVRLISSGFLHVSWLHLIVNMISLWCFSEVLENGLGPLNFILVYFGSLVGGNLFALFVHRNHGDYSAAGASGAISGVVFASIAIVPGLEIGLFGLPYYFPAWIYGLLYVLYSIYGIKSQRDAIGHEAHLGGGIAGLLLAMAMQPEFIMVNALPIACILIPSIFFILMMVYKPNWLLVDNPFKTSQKSYTIEDKYNAKRRANELELDGLLEKIHKKGLNGLSAKEKQRLKDLSN